MRTSQINLIGESWISESLWQYMELEEDEKEPIMIYVENLGCDLVYHQKYVK